MDRLTKRINGEAVHFDCHGTCGTCDGCTCFEIGAMVDRLAAYEDTGLEPEEINALKLASMGKAISEITEFDGVPINHLRELVEAEKDGRLVVLPCKVGDTVYVISYCENVMMNCDDDYETGTGATECPFECDCPFEDCDDGNKRIFETTCSGFFFGDDRKDVFFDHINAEFYITDFGKTVFLTRGAAEGGRMTIQKLKSVRAIRQEADDLSERIDTTST